MIPSDRYLHDPVFSHLVDMLRSILREGNFTPTELREAVLLAASIHESQYIKPLYQTNPDGSFTVWERGKL